MTFPLSLCYLTVKLFGYYSGYYEKSEISTTVSKILTCYLIQSIYYASATDVFLENL